MRVPLGSALLAGVLAMQFGAGAAAATAGTELRIATVAPAGSSFHKRLQALGAEWSRGPGAVRMNIFAGTQGGELQIVRRMRVGQIQGAMLTSVGLGQIERSVTALQLMPLLFRNWEDVDRVRERLAPELERRLFDAGYVVLLWGDAGWVRYFSRTPIRSIQDFRSLRVFASSGDPESIELMQDYYRPVVLEPDQILLGLRNGMIDALPIPAFLANFSQVPTYAPYMLELPWAPVTGALVLTTRAWNQLDETTRAWLRETAARAGPEIRRISRSEDEQAVAAMRDKQGLQVVALSPEAERELRREVERLYPRIRGGLVPAPMFDAAVEVLRAPAGAGT
ncbi:MAG: C4-dicarboxylate ABC transporter substrate-binding protein [Gammaproteobacteria bacterium]|nr:C4-dicarboxylate ABC transporter substrate-binding protein [Gammaproteobacteria bacterium]